MKIIRKSKKAYLVIGLICLVSSILGFTYSAFIVSNNARAAEMYVGNLIYGITIVNEDNTTDGIMGRNITLGVGESKIIKVTLTSLNSVDSKYKLQYKMNSGESIVKYMSTTPSPVKGDIEKEASTNTLDMLIYVENTGSTSSEVSFGASGGYTHNDLNQIELINGYNEITEVYTQGDLRLALTLDGTTVSSLPKTSFYSLANYECQNGSQLNWDVVGGNINFTTTNLPEVCTLNFDTAVGYLRNAALGSYVQYTATNGCTTNCTDLWRLAYIESNRPFITSANNVENVGRDIVNAGSATPFNATVLNSIITPIAMKYCNLEFTGSCTNYGVTGNTTRPFESTDFSKIMSQVYKTSANLTSCLGSTLASCGYGRELLITNAVYIYGNIGYYAGGDEGGYPKYAVNVSDNGVPNERRFGKNYAYPTISISGFGVRPVISLLSNIVIERGSGTQVDPYIIAAP